MERTVPRPVAPVAGTKGGIRVRRLGGQESGTTHALLSQSCESLSEAASGGSGKPEKQGRIDEFDLAKQGFPGGCRDGIDLGVEQRLRYLGFHGGQDGTKPSVIALSAVGEVGLEQNGRSDGER